MSMLKGNFALFLLIVSQAGCLQMANSTQGDRTTFSGSGTGGSTSTDAAHLARWADAKAVITATCVNCHSDHHAAWANYSEQMFLDTRMVIPGDSLNSPIYYQLSGVQGNMPQGGGALSLTDATKIKNWIDKFNESSTTGGGTTTTTGGTTTTTGGTTDAAALARYAAVVTIMQSRCVSCHNNPSNGSVWPNPSTLTDQDWVNANLVVRGNPSSSPLYLKLKNNGINSTGTMPSSGAALTSSQLQAVRDWIQLMP